MRFTLIVRARTSRLRRERRCSRVTPFSSVVRRVRVERERALERRGRRLAGRQRRLVDQIPNDCVLRVHVLLPGAASGNCDCRRGVRSTHVRRGSSLSRTDVLQRATFPPGPTSMSAPDRRGS